MNKKEKEKEEKEEKEDKEKYEEELYERILYRILNDVNESIVPSIKETVISFYEENNEENEKEKENENEKKIKYLENEIKNIKKILNRLK